MPRKTSLQVALQIDLDGPEIAIFSPKVLVIGDKFHEKGLVEGPVRLILPNKHSALVTAAAFRLLEDDDWLKLLVERPERFFERVDNLVVEKHQKLRKNLYPALVLGQ